MTGDGIDLLFYALGMEFGDDYTGLKQWTVGAEPALTYGAWRARWQEQYVIADLVRDGMLEEMRACPDEYVLCTSIHYTVTAKGEAFMRNWWACPELYPDEGDIGDIGW